MWVPAGLRRACSGLSKPPSLASNRGIAFRPAINTCRTNQAHANMQTLRRTLFSSSFHLSAAVFVEHHSSRQRLGSHGTTAALHAFPFVTATNGASSVCVRGCHCRILQQYVGTRNSLKNRGAVQLLLNSIPFSLCCLMLPLLCLYRTVSFSRCGSHGVTVAVLQGIMLVTATTGGACLLYTSDAADE